MKTFGIIEKVSDHIIQLKGERNMTQNEIMLGDWLCLTTNHQPQKIVNVEQLENNVTIIGLVDKDGGYDVVYLNELKPIKLTPEILEKNGFTEDGKLNLSPDYFLEDGDAAIYVNFTATPDKKPFIYVLNKKTRFSSELKCEKAGYGKEYKNSFFVHELQHAFNLAGIEKEIELAGL